jgi:Flp pilus assembly protein TadG
MQGSTTWALTMGRRERGAVAVEMAIILPLLLLVVGGIVDFGRLLFTQNIVTNAAREGARAWSLGYDVPTATARVNQAMLGVPTGTYTVVFKGNGVVNNPCPSSPIATDVAKATVTVTDFNFIFPLPVTAPDPSADSQMRCGG